MRAKDNATPPIAITGLLGVLAFSMSLPATRIAVEDLDAWFVAFGRAVGAGLLALVYLTASRAPRPTRYQWRRLAVVALGVVVGFPLLTSLALQDRTAAHGAVVVALLPAITAGFAVLRAGERPSPAFWLAGGAGLVAVLTFLVAGGAVSGAAGLSDLYLLAAVTLCGLGYAEGGALARELGGARTICWALVLAMPATTAIAAFVALRHPPHAGPAAWAGFGYLTVVSMFLGFFAWYAGLARGGVARTGQLQLAQPVLTLAWSAALLHEHVPVPAVVAASAVLLCVALTQRLRAPRLLVSQHAHRVRG
ncbi:DMT family transporter [Dactylosporangium sp. AC04546]|uniref:DMT family transporter n=1 Tax=Dactylosporangium sp. AC04546 TaxID=2862460 RepID=UPI001EE03A0A|nr:DMT family transporter [Dactylosporangium sp. AC04546]WVK86152.1 DMT family transporter [Dactylosporangium sp. AC04546]